MAEDTGSYGTVMTEDQLRRIQAIGIKVEDVEEVARLMKASLEHALVAFEKIARGEHPDEM
jgi:hypothetical protein